MVGEREYWKKVVGDLSGGVEKDDVREDERMVDTKRIRFRVCEEERGSVVREVDEG